VIQSDHFARHHTVTVLPVTTEILPIDIFRIAVEMSEKNGLRAHSQIMVDKAHTIPHDKAGEAFGVLEARTLSAVNRALAVFQGLGCGSTIPALAAKQERSEDGAPKFTRIIGKNGQKNASEGWRTNGGACLTQDRRGPVAGTGGR
jgi:mRNA interferase MazF